jgi:hypothetical protein
VPPDQRLGNVDAQHVTCGADGAGKLGRRGAGAAADIDDVLAGWAAAASRVRR